MSKYVLAFHAQPGGTASPEQEQAWGAWFGELGPTVTGGDRVGATRMIAGKNGGERGNSTLSGYVVIEAPDLDAAAKIAQGCPGLAYGTDVEVGEVIPS